MKGKRLLYFIDGMKPSEFDIKLAGLFHCGVAFRNAQVAKTEESIESCDYVFGDYPERYAHKVFDISSMEDAVKLLKNELNVKVETVSEVKDPTKIKVTKKSAKTWK